MKDFLPNALDRAISVSQRPKSNLETNRIEEEISNDLRNAVLSQIKNVISKDTSLSKLNIDANDLLSISISTHNNQIDNNNNNNNNNSDNQYNESSILDSNQKNKVQKNLYKKKKNSKKKEKRKLRKQNADDHINNINKNIEDTNNNNNENLPESDYEKEDKSKNIDDTDNNDIYVNDDEFKDVVIEYYQEKDIFDPNDENHFNYFMDIYNRFKLNNDVIVDQKTMKSRPKEVETPHLEYEDLATKPRGYIIDDEDDDDDDNYLNNNNNNNNKNNIFNDDSNKPLTRKQLKNRNRMSVAQLKFAVDRPDIVELHDGNSPDPLLLIHLKSLRNTVPVPSHWSFKRRYLSTQREQNKGFFELPDFIKQTGVETVRDSIREKEMKRSLKSKMRSHMRPEMQKQEIDYQKLHDAFFKYQKKPFLSHHGDLYFEGKELRNRMHQQKKRPGRLSNELRIALGMPLGLNRQQSQRYPPPWLIAQQRYGPPPSYPDLKIPGLNCPIPEGCQFGYQQGGWGKPPVNENGKPLYGDVFGVDTANNHNMNQNESDDDDEKNELWGAFISSDESDSDDNYDNKDVDQDEGDIDGESSGIISVEKDEGIVTPSGTYSSTSILSNIELSKAGLITPSDYEVKNPLPLYTVLPEKQVGIDENQLIGTSHIYDVSSITNNNKDKQINDDNNNNNNDSNANDVNNKEIESKKQIISKVRKTIKTNLKADNKEKDDDDDDDLDELNAKKFKF